MEICSDAVILDIKEGIVFVKFEATWCNICKKINTNIQKVQSEFQSVNFQTIDVDDNPNIAKKYKIISVPTVIVFKDGKEVSRVLGAFKIDAIRKVIRDILAM